MAENKLSVSKINAVKPIDKEQVIGDGGGLWLRVRPLGVGGGKSFIFRYKFGGKSKKLHIGKFPDVGLAEAREKKLDFKKALAKGRDPAFYSASGEGETVKELFELWEGAVLVDHADKGVKIRGHFEFDVFPFMGDQVAKSVEHDQIIDVIERIVRRGAKAKASKVLSWLRALWGFGIRRRIVSADPTAHLKAKDLGAGESIRERNLSFDEIKELGEKYRDSALPPRVEASLWVMLSTGCRTKELRQALVGHVGIKEKQWLLPETKNGKSHVIHLSYFSVYWFERLITLSENEFLLPGLSGKKPVSEDYLRKIIGERVSSVHRKKSTKMFGSLLLSGGKWTPHDLRRTMASRMGDLKIEPHIIEACLNHMPTDLKRVYQQQRYMSERQEAFERWGAKLLEMVPISRG